VYRGGVGDPGTWLRARLAQAWLYARAIRASQVGQPIRPIRPARLLEVARAALRTPFGPHLAAMFYAQLHPDKAAIIEYAAPGVQRLTWGELDATINRLAHALIARGIDGSERGRRVAVMLPNGSEQLIVHQAIARIGATAVLIGSHLKPGEIAHILRDAEPAVTVVHADALAVMSAARTLAPATGPIIVVEHRAPGAATSPLTAAITEWSRALAAASPEPPAVPRGDGGGAIVYTSGTTGAAKGAHRTWRATGYEPVADLMLQLGVRADDRHLVVCPLYHSAAAGFVMMMLALGATVILMNPFDPAAAIDVIERERVTCTLMVPTMLRRLAQLPEDLALGARTASLRWVMSAAATLPTETARQFLHRFGPVLWNFYGATETGLVTLAGPADHLARPGTIGRALRGAEIRLIGDDGRDVPDGQIGELYVQSAMRITGYHRNAAATQAAERDGSFSVGDLGHRDADGYYYLDARTHDLVISGGVNIYPREIEDALHRHPAIADAAVIGVPDPEWGEALRAFVVVRPGHVVSELEVIAYCRAELADYKRPRRVTFVAELPRNPTGKLDKRALHDPP
jgi:fatty-acyl-CoA synthase